MKGPLRRGRRIATISTGAIFIVIITIFGPVSGAHFNPAGVACLRHARRHALAR